MSMSKQVIDMCIEEEEMLLMAAYLQLQTMRKMKHARKKKVSRDEKLVTMQSVSLIV